MRRRDFLAGSLASACLATRAYASPWGAAPDEAMALLLGADARASSVLEVFLYGGLPAFDSFYVVEEFGQADDPDYPNQQYHLFADEHDSRYDRCGLTLPDPVPFAHDSLGRQVSFGPLTQAFLERPDLLSRLRVLVHHHEVEPHEGAIPLALSGFGLGSPRMAGLGASVQRYFQERDTTGRRIPYAYVLYPDTEISTDNLRAASAVGLHPGASRPLDLRIEADSALPERLARGILGERKAAYDALVRFYAERDRRSFRGLRAPAVDDYRFATETLAGAAGLGDLFTAEVLAALPGTSCKTSRETATTAMGLELATHLIRHKTAPARYVTVVDGGLVPATGGGGYDVHTDHMRDASRNLVHLLTELSKRINEPSEQDPGKIDLDETLIVLNTEFGRTPFRQDGGNGTNHHPYGYVTLLLGGPVQEPGIVGAIGRDGHAIDYVTPVEARAAVLAAMGMWPFSPQTFAIGDLRSGPTERDGLVWLSEHVLGRRIS